MHSHHATHSPPTLLSAVSPRPHCRCLAGGVAAAWGAGQPLPAKKRLAPGSACSLPLHLRNRQRHWRPCSLSRRNRRRRRPLRRRLPLRRPRDAQRRLLSVGEAAQAHFLAAAPHPGLEGLRMVGLVKAHAEVARLVVGPKQRQPLRLRLLSNLLARQWRCRRRG